MEIGQISFFLDIAACDSVPDGTVRFLRMHTIAETAFPEKRTKFAVEISKIVSFDMKHIQKRIAWGIHQKMAILSPDELSVTGRSAAAAGVPADSTCLEMGTGQEVIQQTGFPDARRP